MDGINIGRIIILVGVLTVFFGLLVWGASKVGIPFGNFPGDIKIQGEHSSFYFPIVTSIVISIVLTLGVNFLLWIFRK